MPPRRTRNDAIDEYGDPVTLPAAATGSVLHRR